MSVSNELACDRLDILPEDLVYRCLRDCCLYDVFQDTAYERNLFHSGIFGNGLPLSLSGSDIH